LFLLVFRLARTSHFYRIMKSPESSIANALRVARETKALEIGVHNLDHAPRIVKEQFGSDQQVVLVADQNSFAAAGQAVQAAFQKAGYTCLPPFIFSDPNLYAEYKFVDQLEAALKPHQAIPVAVGAGTLNDLTKLASHLVGRPYMCVATAASMDGYTAFGASITKDGSKQTFQCPAPRAVLADLEVIRAAPEGLNASGYADLIAKVTAGADWLVADELGIEPVDATAWGIVQNDLRELVADPAGVKARDPKAVAKLVEGLMLGGFAMQSARSSRPASGAEHQFSHLWDMQHHTHNGTVPSHGFKVGIGSLAVTALYEFLLQQPIAELDIEACCKSWPDLQAQKNKIGSAFNQDDLRAIATAETTAKFVSREQLRSQLTRLREMWPKLKIKLERQLLSFDELAGMLKAAGAPARPEEIGITYARLRESCWQASYIRRRFTVLDLAVRAGLLEPALTHIFGPQGRWPTQTAQALAATST
jgi:glycerol-1-phosphate dehydrogenase [NAD(P)+]